MAKLNLKIVAAALGIAMSLGSTTAYAQATAAVEIKPAAPLEDVGRENTLVLGWSVTSPIGVTNPWAVPGYSSSEGNSIMWEGLMYFGIFTDKDIPWLAESIEYTSDDFTSLRIKLNPMAKWSDGVSVTAKDVVFTMEGQLSNELLRFNSTFNTFVDSVTVVDDQTVDLTFKLPAPRFKFDVLTMKFDSGMAIVPAHAFDGIDNVNEYAGGVEMPHSGPYDLVAWNQNQKIFNLREDWWAAEAGINDLPDVKRVIVVNLGGQIGQNMDTVAQRLVNNEMDSALDMRSAVISNILRQNPKITTHSGSESPFGYLDWWPNALWMNTESGPFADVRVRRAVSLAVNRPQVNDVLYDGADIATIVPFPLYPGLQKLMDSPGVQALIEKYQPGKFDLDESAALMAEAGYAKNGDGFWEKDGETVDSTIAGFEGIHSDIVPILVEMLRNGGFDASTNFGTDAFQNMADGAPGLYMFGHGASLKDPFATLDFFNSRNAGTPGESVGAYQFARYSNPEYDEIMAKMSVISSDHPDFEGLATQALEIYWRDQINVPVIQWLHRIAYNQTYWTNWPTEANVGLGMNGAFWHKTALLMVSNLKSAE
ncbi:MAG: ABC transporter substrate-binding protein [Alphaproteobacteria bacterium]|nr:ABC transporter substrate-binding protein [Alphaproteobacteria bacterium]